MKTLIASFIALNVFSSLAFADQPYIREQPGFIICNPIKFPGQVGNSWVCTAGVPDFIPVVNQDGLAVRTLNIANVQCMPRELHCYENKVGYKAGAYNPKLSKMGTARVPLGYEFIGYNDEHAIAVNSWRADEEQVQRGINAWRLMEGVDNF